MFNFVSSGAKKNAYRPTDFFFFTDPISDKMFIPKLPDFKSYSWSMSLTYDLYFPLVSIIIKFNRKFNHTEYIANLKKIISSFIWRFSKDFSYIFSYYTRYLVVSFKIFNEPVSILEFKKYKRKRLNKSHPFGYIVFSIQRMILFLHTSFFCGTKSSENLL